MRFGLNRSKLKTIALIFMVIDHIGLFLPGVFGLMSHPITRFVAPLFAYLMVDGFFYTKSRGKYCLRLWIAAILMQIGDVLSFLVFKENGIQNNIFLTLAFGFSIIWLFEIAKISETKGKRIGFRVLAIVLTLISIILSGVWIPLCFGCKLGVEGGLELIPFILIVYFFYKSKWKQAVGIFAYSMLQLFLLYGGIEMFSDIQMLCINCEWMTFIVIPFIFLYNGEEGKKSKFGKWFFYVFYPLHLWVIEVVRMMVG